MDEYRSVNFQNHRIGTAAESGNEIGKIIEASVAAGGIRVVGGILQSGDGIEPGGFDYDLVSFQAVDGSGNLSSPPRYLRVQNATQQTDRKLVLEELPASSDAQKQFRKDATFEMVPPLHTFSGQDNGDLASFKSITVDPPTINEGAFVRHFHYRLILTDNTVNPSIFTQDATFRRVESAQHLHVSYEVGDTHPNGGIVFSVDATGEHGWVVMAEDLGRFSFEDAIESARGFEDGSWTLPSISQLSEIYAELHVDLNLGGFQSTVYRSGTSSGYPQYPWALNFSNGSKTGDGLANQTLVRLVTSF